MICRYDRVIAGRVNLGFGEWFYWTSEAATSDESHIWRSGSAHPKVGKGRFTLGLPTFAKHVPSDQTMTASWKVSAKDQWQTEVRERNGTHVDRARRTHATSPGRYLTHHCWTLSFLPALKLKIFDSVYLECLYDEPGAWQSFQRSVCEVDAYRASEEPKLYQTINGVWPKMLRWANLSPTFKWNWVAGMGIQT